MVTITLKGREIPLLYTTWEMKQMQEEIAPLSKLNYVIFGRNPDDKVDTKIFGSADHLAAVAKMIRILGNAGLEEAGKEADLTDKKVLRSIRPGQLAEIVNICAQALKEGMESEIPEKQEEGPVDVTLEEINKKKEKED